MSRRLPGAFSLAAAIALWAALSGCEGTDAASAAAGSCVEDDLIAQCPPGSDPVLEASATSMCSGSGSFSSSADGGLLPVEGHVEGVCRGEGDCKVYCHFQVPCECGVDRITDDGIFCRDCMTVAACGNGQCEGTESPEACPEDCACVCTNGDSRCNGTAIQICERCMFTELACPENEVCRAQAAGGAKCERNGI